MIIQTIVILMFLIVGFIFLKAEHQTRKVKIIIIVVLGFLLYFSIVSLFTSEEVDITSPRGIARTTYVYFGWIGRTATNLWDVGVNTVRLTGKAIKFNNTTPEEPQR